ncbi:pre-peptidase C-terminal domain-containing protein [Pedobacter alpinus]|uniref:Pre-peptidase C-terminal domain-containing protein n=1 Tax=Pedobacter alpinus TaxID=1590643 RepID=A0ABW5TPU1_9SPHI
MKNQFKVYLFLTLLSLSHISCEKIKEIDKDIDFAVEDLLGVKILTEELDKSSTNYNGVKDFVLNNKLLSTSESKIQIVPVNSYSFNLIRANVVNSMITNTTKTFTGTISKSLFGNSSNTIKIEILNNNPRIYVNNALATTPTQGGGSGGTTNPGTNVTALVNTILEGNVYETKTISFNVPAGTKSMTVKTSESGGAYYNTADLFVKKGSAPLVVGPKPPTNLPKYSWTADCYSIKPNREQEACTFNNPSAGTWYASLYGFNLYFNSNVTVTITN